MGISDSQAELHFVKVCGVDKQAYKRKHCILQGTVPRMAELGVCQGFVHYPKIYTAECDESGICKVYGEYTMVSVSAVYPLESERLRRNADE